jgi:hypothetical protein
MSRKENRVRIFNICSRKFDNTGKELINEKVIQMAIDNHKSIERFAYILHDKDTITVKGYNELACEHIIEEYNEKLKITDVLSDSEYLELARAKRVLQENAAKFEAERTTEPKPPHYHIVLQLNTPQTVDTVAKWFGIPSNFVDIPKGRNPYKFLDCAEYLTHESPKEQAKGKYRYLDSEVHYGGFDFREEIDNKQNRAIKYGTADFALQLKMDIVQGKYTLKQVKEQFSEYYLKNPRNYQIARLTYLELAQPPKTRINYYVSGEGGLGKTLLSRALAVQLALMVNPTLTESCDMYYEITDGRVAFDGYDGQPVIIWNDFRANDLLKAFNYDRGTAFAVFDTHPERVSVNIKYGKAYLNNTFNIINSVQSKYDFLDGLAGEYGEGDNLHRAEDKNQSYRRFPMLIDINSESYDFFLNRGFFEDTREYQQFIEYMTITGNFKAIQQNLVDLPEQKREIEKRVLSLPLEKTKECLDKDTGDKEKTEEEIQQILEQFKDYGKQKKNTYNNQISDECFEQLMLGFGGATVIEQKGGKNNE